MSGIPSEPTGSSLPGNQPAAEEPPRFGAVDIVEAFTAMRHEWRGQTKETRALAEQIQAAVASIQALEPRLLASVAEARGSGRDADEAAAAKPLVLLAVDTDHHLSRAVSAIAQWETNRQLRAEADSKAIEQHVARMGWLARWFARPLLTLLAERQAVQEASAAVEGLNLVLARLRRAMNEQGIERLDTLGREFDANTMYAIGTVATADYPAGYVAEQLSPAYLWKGQMLRFAEVRVAENRAGETDQ